MRYLKRKSRGSRISGPQITRRKIVRYTLPTRTGYNATTTACIIYLAPVDIIVHHSSISEDEHYTLKVSADYQHIIIICYDTILYKHGSYLVN